ncbi:MAG: HAMP domain-containing histidine kinase [Chloroflexi bacterium]|nr:MAG: HAMP domain-containing histidine kinase [Chloroflexota bacterium]
MVTKIRKMDEYVDQREDLFKRMSFEQRATLQRHYIASTPKWRRPAIGYLVSIPLTVAATASNLYLRQMFSNGAFYPGSIQALLVFFIAILWGVGPSLLTILLSTLLMDFFFLPPVNQLNLENLFQSLPSIISGLAIALIAAQRERARLKTLAAEQELQEYAQELVEINQKLTEANEMKDRFISIASHELKTPITTIRGQAQLALRRLSKQPDLSPQLDSLHTSLERINEQTGRLTALIDELLDVSSIRTGKAELRKRTCDLREICREVIDDQRLLTGRQIALNVPPTPLKLHADCDRLSQVLVNLVSNAVKYSPEKTAIQVALNASDDHHVLIEVHDHGKGIAADQLPYIFETFYRTPDAQTSSKPGLGLGLAISKEIVERHNGRIWCESKPGQGSTFFVELPL